MRALLGIILIPIFGYLGVLWSVMLLDWIVQNEVITTRYLQSGLPIVQRGNCPVDKAIRDLGLSEDDVDEAEAGPNDVTLWLVEEQSIEVPRDRGILYVNTDIEAGIKPGETTPDAEAFQVVYRDCGSAPKAAARR